MTQESKKVEVFEAYKNAINEFFRAREVYEKLIDEAFGENAEKYRDLRKYYTPEIKAAARAYNAAKRKMKRTEQVYCDVNKINLNLNKRNLKR